MKLRIHHNSFRFRLKQPELALFRENGLIKETVEFGPAASAHLIFELRVDGNAFTVFFQNGHLIFTIPIDLVNTWIDTAQVGIEQEVQTPDNRTVMLLVEKDFHCSVACPSDNEGTFDFSSELQKDY